MNEQVKIFVIVIHKRRLFIIVPQFISLQNMKKYPQRLGAQGHYKFFTDIL